MNLIKFQINFIYEEFWLVGCHVIYSPIYITFTSVSEERIGFSFMIKYMLKQASGKK